MNIEFIKMNGSGNDYIYIDLLKNNYSVDFNNLSKDISQRHFGVGGDGLVLIMASERANFKMRMFNSDGSEAEMCGNAIRCVGKYLYDYSYVNKKHFSIETLAGIKKLWLVEEDPSGGAKRLKVDMGEPILNPKEIPINIKIDKEPAVGIDVMGYRATAVSMGNPHIVIFVDNITDELVLNHGPKIEKHLLFPQKTNVEFIKIIDKNTISMRVWERGSGETLACGTGACASVVAGVLNNLTSRKVNVNLLGGTLHIEWNEDNNRVYLTGPASEVFTGVYHY